MILVNLLTWILVSFGITLAVTQGSIFDGLRTRATNMHPKLGQLLGCPMCFGFWVGMGLNVFYKPITSFILWDGFLSLSTCWILYCMCLWFTHDDDRA
jgi:hypothetical protein